MTFSDRLHLHLVSMHTSPLDQPGSGDAGGMNVYMAQSLRALLELYPRLTVEVFTLLPTAPSQAQVSWAERALVHQLYLPEAEGFTKEDLPQHLEAFARAMRDSARQAPDLVHAHYWLSGLAASLAHPDTPLVATLHTSAAGKNRQLAAGQAAEPDSRYQAEQDLLDRIWALVVNTLQEAEQMLADYRLDPAKVHLVSPGVDSSVFRPLPGVSPAHAGSSTKAHLVFAGRPQPLKGPHLVLEALALLPADLEVSFDLVGSSGSGYEQSLLARAEELGLADRIRLLPAQAPQQLAQTLREADLVVVPSSSETFGLLALEAQACGSPVLASDIPGLASILEDGVTGLLVDSPTPAAWAQAIDRAVRNPQLRQRLGRAGAAAARERTWQTTAQKLHQLYQNILTQTQKEKP